MLTGGCCQISGPSKLFRCPLVLASGWNGWARSDTIIWLSLIYCRHQYEMLQDGVTLSPVAIETEVQPNWQCTKWVMRGQLQDFLHPDWFSTGHVPPDGTCPCFCCFFRIVFSPHCCSWVYFWLVTHSEWTLLLKEADILQLSADCLCYVWRGEPETAEAVWPPGWVNGSLPFAARINITQRCLITMPNASRWRPTVAAPIKITSL